MTLFQAVAAAVVWLTGQLVAFASWIGSLWTDLVNFITVVLPDFLDQLVAPITDYLGVAPWEGLVGFLDLVDYVLPVYAAMGIWLGAFGVCFLIRLVRWVLAFIPTIGG